MNKFFLFLPLAILSMTGCAGNAGSPTTATTADSSVIDGQSIELTVDGVKYNVTNDDVYSANLIGGAMLGIGVMSEKANFQFTVLASVQSLKVGTYDVYDCKGPSECDQARDDLNETAVYAPYPTDPMPPVATSRTAYKAAPLGLSPLTLTVAEIKDEQQPGNPWKTKRIRGSVRGAMVYVERTVSGDWVIKSSSKVEGKFNMFCSMR